MARISFLCMAALLTFSGCISGLFDFTSSSGTSQAIADWQATSHFQHGDGLGIWAIEFGTVGQTDYPRHRPLACIKWHTESSGTRSSWVSPPKPYVSLTDEWFVPVLQLEVEMRYFDQLRFADDGRRFLFPSTNGICIFDMHDGTIQKKLRRSEKSGYAISQDSSIGAVLVEEGEICRIDVYDIQTEELRHSLDLKGQDVNSMKFVKSDLRLAFVCSGKTSKDYTLKFWSLKTDNVLTTCEIPSPVLCGPWGSVLSLDGSRYAAEVDNTAVSIWNAETGKVLCTTKPHTGDIRFVTFSHDGQLLASGAEGLKNDKAVGEIKIWDATTGKEIATIIDDTSWGVTALAFSPDGTELASGNGDGHIRFWKVPEQYAASVATK